MVFTKSILDKQKANYGSKTSGLIRVILKDEESQMILPPKKDRKGHHIQDSILTRGT